MLLLSMMWDVIFRNDIPNLEYIGGLHLFIGLLVLSDTVLDLRSFSKPSLLGLYMCALVLAFPVTYTQKTSLYRDALVILLTSAPYIGIWPLTSSERYAEVERLILDKELPEHLCGALSKVEGLNTLHVTHKDKAVQNREEHYRETLVLLHGMGGGNVLWVQSLGVLAKKYDVYCVELPGMGGSDRPDWSAWDPTQAIALFQERLESWRTAIGLDKFALLGHSLGAMVAAAYAVRFGHHVKALVLVSPVGVAAYDEFVKPTKGPAAVMLSGSFPARLACWMWEQHIGPFDVLRAVGPFARSVVTWVMDKKISRSDGTSYLRQSSDESRALMNEYLYHNWCLSPSGERAVTVLLGPGVCPRLPICTWLRVAGQNARSEFTLHVPCILGPGISKDCSVSLIYGDENNDWMDKNHGDRLVAQLREDGCHHVYSTRVAGAGHLVNLDQPFTFADSVIQVLERKIGKQ